MAIDIIKYIDTKYMTEIFGKITWADEPEGDFYIGRASTKIRTIIFDTEAGGTPDDITSYTEQQQNAIKEATAIYALYYQSINYDFSSGSVSVSFGGTSMSESRQYNGEPILPTVYELLKTVNLIPVVDVIAFDFETGKADFIEDEPSTPSINDIWKKLLQVDDKTIQLSKQISGLDVRLAGNNTFTGTNIFANIINVPTPTMLASATPREYVDDLIAKIDVSDKASLTKLNNFSGTNNFNGIITTPTEPINNYDVVNKIYSDLENSKTYAKAKLYIDKEIAKIPSGKIYTGTAPIIINDTNISLDETGIATQDEINSINAKLTPLLPKVQQIETELTNKASLNEINDFSELNIFRNGVSFKNGANVDIVGTNPTSITNKEFVYNEIAKIPSGKIYTGTAPIIINDTIISLDETGIATKNDINSINLILTPLHQDVEIAKINISNLDILTRAQTIKIDTNKSNIDALITLTTTNKNNIATNTTDITNINAKFIKKECRWTGTNLTMDGIEIDPTIYAFMSIVSNSITDNWTILNRLNAYILYKLGLDGTLIKETRAINIWCAFIKF